METSKKISKLSKTLGSCKSKLKLIKFLSVFRRLRVSYFLHLSNNIIFSDKMHSSLESTFEKYQNTELATTGEGPISDVDK